MMIFKKAVLAVLFGLIETLIVGYVFFKMTGIILNWQMSTYSVIALGTISWIVARAIKSILSIEILENEDRSDVGETEDSLYFNNKDK